MENIETLHFIRELGLITQFFNLDNHNIIIVYDVVGELVSYTIVE